MPTTLTHNGAGHPVLRLVESAPESAAHLEARAALGRVLGLDPHDRPPPICAVERMAEELARARLAGADEMNDGLMARIDEVNGRIDRNVRMLEEAGLGEVLPQAKAHDMQRYGLLASIVSAALLVASLVWFGLTVGWIALGILLALFFSAVFVGHFAATRFLRWLS